MIILVCVPLLYIGGVVLYRLYFHPIRAFPGPKLAAATSLYEFYYNVLKGGMFIWEVERMHLKYGPIVRIAPNELHVKDPDFFDEIYAGPSKRRDRHLPSTRMLGLPESSAATVEHDLHRTRRKVLANYFSKQSVRGLEPLIQEKIEKLVTRLKQTHRDKAIIKIDAAFTAFTADITSHYAHGYSYNYLDDVNFRNDVREAIINLLSLGHLFSFFPFLPVLLRKTPRWLVQRFHSGAAQILEFRDTLRQQAKQALSSARTGHKSSDNRTLFDAMTAPSVPKEEVTLSRLENEGFLLLGAGTETTAQPLTVIMFYLLRDKPLLSKLRQELVAHSLTESGDCPTSDSLENLPYLRAVINEGLRMANGPMSRLSRVAPDEALNYKGWLIPPGTAISEYGYFVHRDKDIFPDPFTFNPDRWMKVNRGENLESRIVAFSRGSRQCIGKNLALAMLYLAVANIVHRFDMDLYETGLESIEPVRDLVFGIPRNTVDGVRVCVTHVFD